MKRSTKRREMFLFTPISFKLTMYIPVLCALKSSSSHLPMRDHSSSLRPNDLTLNINSNKKVVLRERKRHTARHVVSTPSVVLPGYPPPGGGGVPDPGTPPRGGVPDPGGYRTWVPPPRGGVPGPPLPPPGVDRQTK